MGGLCTPDLSSPKLSVYSTVVLLMYELEYKLQLYVYKSPAALAWTGC